MIILSAARRPATAGQVDAALARLGQERGLYFGVEAGVPGLHPLQATLLVRPALSLRLFGDGLQAQALTALGATLLDRLPGKAPWRGPGGHPIEQLRGFMRALSPSPDVLLMGALPFAAHRLATGAGRDDALGFFFLAQRYFRRGESGEWTEVELGLEGADCDDSDSAVSYPPARDAASDPPRDDYAPGGYAAMVRRALVHLKREPLVSLTLSQSYRRRVDKPASEAFALLRRANPAPACFFVNDGSGESLFGASPDLQLVVRDGTVQSLPVCGTVARRPGAVGEAESLKELINEEVDAASLAVCSDALRNDLAPLCEPGSLQLLDRRRPMTLATLVHTVDRISGRLREGKDVWDAIVATAAPVMLTGTPRTEALAAITQLEASPRGWYGGMVVQVAANGDALAGTILRAASVRNGVAEVRTGGDLLADSTPEREEQESRLKTLSLWRAFGLEPGPALGQPGKTSGPALPTEVALLDAQDPFGAALADCLQGMGVRLSADAPVSVVAGAGAAAVRPARRFVAIGDAAAMVLGHEGFDVTAITPENGRLVHCTATAPIQSSFIAARYLRWQVLSTASTAEWEAWAQDETGRPQVLVHPVRQIACFLFRPDSLLSQPQARDLLAAALALCSAG